VIFCLAKTKIAAATEIVVDVILEDDPVLSFTTDDIHYITDFTDSVHCTTVGFASLSALCLVLVK